MRNREQYNHCHVVSVDSYRHLVNYVVTRSVVNVHIVTHAQVHYNWDEIKVNNTFFDRFDDLFIIFRICFLDQIILIVHVVH